MNKYSVFTVYIILFSYCSNSIANMGTFPEGMFCLSEEDKLLLLIIAGISIILGLFGAGVIYIKYKKIKIWLFTVIISIVIFYETIRINLTSKLTLTIFSYGLKQPQEKTAGY